MQESQDIPKFIAFGLPIKIKKTKKNSIHGIKKSDVCGMSMKHKNKPLSRHVWLDIWDTLRM
mgnify:CR=1 FL=1